MGLVVSPKEASLRGAPTWNVRRGERSCLGRYKAGPITLVLLLMIVVLRGSVLTALLDEEEAILDVRLTMAIPVLLCIWYQVRDS